MKKTATYIAGIGFVAALIVYVFLSNNVREQREGGRQAPAEPQTANQTEDSVDQERQIEVESQTAVPPVISQYNNPQPVLSDSSNEWMKKVGFTTEYNLHFLHIDYLKNQAANGDMLAAQMLGSQLMGSEEGDRYLTDAARWGSISALHSLSASYRFKAEGRFTDHQENSINQHDASVTALAYLFVARLRGDTLAAPNSVEILMRRMNYTDADINTACEEANDIFEGLSKDRLAEGHYFFDNTPPPDFPFSLQIDGLCGY